MTDTVRTRLDTLEATGLPATVTATASELNLSDTSAQTETLTAEGAISVTTRITKVELAGAGAITLAVPDASMLGVVKIIDQSADNGAVTLSLANVQGGSAATTATFADVNDALILVGGVSKWHVIGESGVALS